MIDILLIFSVVFSYNAYIIGKKILSTVSEESVKLTME